ncbi:MAG TPA: hypothetical protein VEW48_15425 [Thermoanaerobaculia bacterium]|nr:hypothetical protein [Thermoanaerobaculia bacterium]
MTFGAAFLVHPDLFPARRGGETWGAQAVTINLPGGPYRFAGLAPAQVEAVRARFGAYIKGMGDAGAAVESLVFRMAEEEVREIDTRGWEYGLDLDAAPGAVRLAGMRLAGRLDWRPGLAGSLWTPDGGSESFAGIFENFFRVLTAYRLLEQGGLLVHGAAVAAGGRSLLALGRSGAGKTTFARLALARGAEVLSDDLNALRRTGGGTVVEKLPFTGDLGDSASPAGPLPLAALLRLEKSPHDELVPLGRAEGVGLLLACSPYVNVDPHRREALLANLAALLPAAGDPPAWALRFTLGGDCWPILERQCLRSTPAAS